MSCTTITGWGGSPPKTYIQVFLKNWGGSNGSGRWPGLHKLYVDQCGGGSVIFKGGRGVLGSYTLVIHSFAGQKVARTSGCVVVSHLPVLLAYTQPQTLNPKPRMRSKFRARFHMAQGWGSQLRVLSLELRVEGLGLALQERIQRLLSCFLDPCCGLYIDPEP